ncbi:MAG: riboflavin synthase [Planctomycetes bacterium]|nr:riboflavin synthase [Planctomycetota bacterium]
MFTGLIEAICPVKTLRQSSNGMQITVDLASLAQGTNIGDSIAINGTCLTVTKIDGQLATFDVSGETIQKSAIDKLTPATLVNVERAMLPTQRFGGHFVQGHIDGTAKIQTIQNKGQFREIEFAASEKLLNQLIEKGSVAVNGISLTIAKLKQTSFTIAVIPQTWENTTLQKAKIGDTLNIETDIIVKTVKKQLEQILPQEGNLTEDKLRQLGF